MIRQPMFWLLVTLIVLIVANPAMEVFLGERVVLFLLPLTSLFLVAAICVSSDRLRWRVFAVTFSAAWIGLVVASLATRSAALGLASDAVIFSLLFFTSISLLARVLHQKRIDSNALCGAFAAYLLIGVAWAVSYRILDSFAPGAFFVPESMQSDDWGLYLYFSLATLTTLGYGDIVPVNPLARVWASLEAVVGVLYVAALVARLVGLYQRGGSQP